MLCSNYKEIEESSKFETSFPQLPGDKKKNRVFLIEPVLRVMAEPA